MTRKLLVLFMFMLFIFAGAYVWSATTGTTRTLNETTPVQLVDENLLMYGNKTVNNKIRTVTTPYYFEISAGNIANHAPRHISGEVSATVLDTHVDLSQLGVNTIPIPATATIMELISTSAQDGVAGTGALTVHVYGLDTNYDEINETVTTNGTTAVATTNSYIRLNYAYVATAGSGKAASGIISIQATGGGTEYMRISTGHANSQQAHFTIPNGKTGYGLRWSAGSTNKETLIYLMVTADPFDNDVHPGIYYVYDTITNKDADSEHVFNLPIKLPAKTDIKLVSEAIDAGGGNASGMFELFYENE